jgi:hypothetical protein
MEQLISITCAQMDASGLRLLLIASEAVQALAHKNFSFRGQRLSECRSSTNVSMMLKGNQYGDGPRHMISVRRKVLGPRKLACKL